MNKKYTYVWTEREDLSLPNNNYSDEKEYIVTDGVYNFEDWLRDMICRNSDGNWAVEREGNTFYILDGCNERTGEAYLLISEENTNDDLCN